MRWIAALMPTIADQRDRICYRDLLLFGGILFVATAAVYLSTTSWQLPFPQDNDSGSGSRFFELLDVWAGDGRRRPRPLLRCRRV